MPTGTTPTRPIWHTAPMDDNADAKRISLALHRRTGEDLQDAPRITWLSTIQHIGDVTISESPSIWGWCRYQALRNLRVACQYDVAAHAVQCTRHAINTASATDPESWPRPTVSIPWVVVLTHSLDCIHALSTAQWSASSSLRRLRLIKNWLLSVSDHILKSLDE